MAEGEKVGQEQIHTLLFEEKLSWQALIYDLINSEQLDPWNIDLTVLAQKYLEKVRLLEEANFFISSKVLLAASLLLRIKSEIVLNRDIPALDDILFGKKEEKVYIQERIELAEGEIPDLVPRSPMPRFRRVTLQELMAALGKAINTESRRIRKEILVHQAEREAAIAMPKRTFNLQQRIKDIYTRLKQIFATKDGRMSFSEFMEGAEFGDRISAFVSLLHLDNQQKVWLEQQQHFDEIYIWLKELYELVHKDKLELLRAEVEAFMRDAEKEQEQSDLSMQEGEALEDDAAERKVSKRTRVDDESEE